MSTTTPQDHTTQPRYRIAADLQSKDATAIDMGSMFAKGLRDIVLSTRPRRIIETGTYRGRGTTSVIATALRDAGLENASFHSIEVNPHNVDRARTWLAGRGLSARIHCGLSVPRALLPSMQQIEESYVRNVAEDGLIVDHAEAERARLYFSETDFPEAEDDLLGTLLATFHHRPDLVLLDSGGHMGFVEFQHVLRLIEGPCYLALDDVYHVKHFQSFRAIQNDARFELVTASEEKFGFCIARFDPTKSNAA